MNHRTVPPEVARFALILGAALSACDAANARSLHGALTSLGVEDAPAKPPVSFQVLCDRSVGSPCEHGLAMQTIERVLREAVTRDQAHVQATLDAVRAWKQTLQVDVANLLGVTVTFSDADGD